MPPPSRRAILGIVKSRLKSLAQEGAAQARGITCQFAVLPGYIGTEDGCVANSREDRAQFERSFPQFPARPVGCETRGDRALALTPFLVSDEHRLVRFNGCPDSRANGAHVFFRLAVSGPEQGGFRRLWPCAGSARGVPPLSPPNPLRATDGPGVAWQRSFVRPMKSYGNAHRGRRAAILFSVAGTRASVTPVACRVRRRRGG